MISSRQFVVKSQTWTSVGVLVLGLLSAWTIGGWLATEDLNSVIFAALGIVVIVIGVAIIRDWRAGVFIFFAWLLFEDFVRKYMGNNMVIYFAKDALGAILYFSFFAAVRRRSAILPHFPFLIYVNFFFWLGVLQCFNPSSPSLLYSLLGFKLYFFYIPLLFIGYALIRTDEDLHRFLFINIGVAGPIAALGIIQSIVGPSFLNPTVLAPDIRELSTLYRRAPITGATLYQPNSVFVSAGRFDEYLLIPWLLGLGGAAYLLMQRRRGQSIVFVSVALVAVAAIMGGGRGAMMLVLGSGLVFGAASLWGAPRRWSQAHRLVKAIWRAAAVAGVAVLIIVFIYPEAVGARWSYYVETILPSSPAEQLTFRLKSYPIQEFEKAFASSGWVFGHGIGTASLGAQYVSRWLGQRGPALGVESGYGNILIEYGILGLFFWLIWTTAVLIYAWKVVRKMRETVYFPLAFAIFWFALLLLYPMTYGTLNSYQDFVYNAYFWLLIGVLFRLPTLASESARIAMPQVAVVHEE